MDVKNRKTQECNELSDALARIDEGIVHLAQFVTRVRRFNLINAATGLAVDRAAVIILRVLEKEGPIRPNELASELDVKPPHVTRKLTYLVNLGYVRRISDPKDRRACLVELTEQGRVAARKIRQVSTAAIREALAGWDRDDITHFADAFDRMITDYLAHADSRFDHKAVRRRTHK